MAFVLAWLIKETTSFRDGTVVGLAGGVLVAATLGQFWLFEARPCATWRPTSATSSSA